jgi:uncharacterized RDD family membrane protein YckC
MDEMSDPYRAPSSAVDDVVAPGELMVATRGRRFLTYLVDALVMWVVNFVVTLAVFSVRGQPQPGSSQFFLQLSLSLACTTVYYIVMEAAWSRTVGKFVCGTIVVDESGRRPSLGQVVGRSFARFIPFEFLSIFGGPRVMWHDSLPHTRVVMANTLR